MADNQVVDSLRLRVAGAGNNTWPQFSVSPSNSLWLTDSADPLNTSPNAALQISITPSSAFIEALGTDGVSSKQLQLGNAGGVALVPNGGNVGIGTTTPSQALEVAGAVKATSFLLGNTPLVSSQWTSGAGGISFAGGKVGVGTATPSEMLEVAGTVKATSFLLGNAPIVSSQWTSGAGGLSFAGGNVGVGTATPSETLEVAGSVKATSFLLGNAPIVSSQWTSGAGGISFAGGAVGIGTATPSQALEVAGTVKASAFLLGNAPLVNSQWTNVAGGINFAGGKVGIGTTTPNGLLDVGNIVRIGLDEGGSGAKVITFARDAADEGNSGKIAYKPSWDGGVLGIVGVGAPNHPRRVKVWDQVETSGSLLVGGAVGIGVPSPGFSLDVGARMRARQGSDASAGIWFYQTGPANDRAFVGMANDNQVGFWGNTGAAWGLVMDTSSGAVGIGTTNPTNKLTVDIGPNGPVDTGITIQGSTSAAGDLGVRINNTGAGGIEWYIDSTNNKSGYGGGKLAFVPVVGSLPTVTMLQSGDMTVRGHLWVNGTDIHLTGRGGGNGNNNAWGRALVDLGQGGGLVVNYDNDFGQVRIDGPVFARVVGAPSDARLKTNITPLTGVLDKLEQIRGVGFEWTGAEAALTGPAGAPAIGLIAQEVEAVFPELVLRWGENDYRAIDYSRLTSVLVEAVKELRREVAALKTAPGAAAG